MNCDVTLKFVSAVSSERMTLPDFRVGVTGADEPAVVPIKEPETVPARPDVEPEPNTIPHREPVPEPDVAPCERPGTSCPVHG